MHRNAYNRTHHFDPRHKLNQFDPRHKFGVGGSSLNESPLIFAMLGHTYNKPAFNKFLELTWKIESFAWHNLVDVLEYTLLESFFFNSSGFTRKIIMKV